MHVYKYIYKYIYIYIEGCGVHTSPRGEEHESEASNIEHLAAENTTPNMRARIFGESLDTSNTDDKKNPVPVSKPQVI